MNGFITLHRKIIDWEWYTDINVKCLFIHLLLMANHSEEKWRGQVIKRGEYVTSYAHLSQQTGLSIQQVRTALKKLEKTNDVTIKTTNRNTVIMVVKYDFYQSEQQTTNKQTTRRITNKQQSSNNQVTTNNNDNNDNNDNNKYIVLIVDFLNQTLGTRYSYKNKQYNELINARLNEGFTVEDFKTVILKKANEWTGTDMEKYLTPSTLFRASNFEKYLNQKIQPKQDINLPNWYSEVESTKPNTELMQEALDLQRQLKDSA